MEQKTFAERLKWLRSQRDLTQRELAEKTGISIPAIVRYEGGRSEPRLRTVMRLAHVLGVDAAELAPEMIAGTTELEISFSPEQHAKLEEAAAARGCSIEELVIDTINEARERMMADPKTRKEFEAELARIRAEKESSKQ